MPSTLPLHVIGRLAAGIAVVVPAAANAFVCVVASGLGCDESCTLMLGEGSRPGVRWMDTADAWQWSAIGALGLASLVLALACAIALHVGAARRRGVPRALLALALLAGAAPWVMLL